MFRSVVERLEARDLLMLPGHAREEVLPGPTRGRVGPNSVGPNTIRRVPSTVAKHRMASAHMTHCVAQPCGRPPGDWRSDRQAVLIIYDGRRAGRRCDYYVLL